MQARSCPACGLIFRLPRAAQSASDAFYQDDYKEGMTSDTPDDLALASMKADQFAGHNLSYADRIALIRTVAQDGRLLDYGASWGYGVFQLLAAGFDAEGFEVSRPRADFGRDKLGVKIITNADELPDAAFDVVHTAHVLEHIPDPHIAFADFKRLVKPGGFVVLQVPNGAGPSALRHGVKWPMLLNEVHVLALTAAFAARAFNDYGFDIVDIDDKLDELRVTARKRAA